MTRRYERRSTTGWFCDSNRYKKIQPLLEELVEKGTVPADTFRTNTPSNTNEFGFYDFNNNTIFVMEVID